MFKQRLLTILALVPCILLIIYYATAQLFAIGVIVVVLSCGWEWLKLIPIKNNLTRFFLIVFLLLACFLIPFIYISWLIVGILLWMVISLFIVNFPNLRHVWSYPVVVASFYFILLPLFAQSLIATFSLENGRNYLMYLLLVVWAMDIGAYLIGKQWGRHQLIAAVSPKKTVEGLIGGLVLMTLVALIGFYWLQPFSFLKWFILSLSVALMSIVGDLFISMLKRRLNVKDTGNLLPGHGGILDRLDSLIAAAPFFYGGFLYLTLRF